VRTDGPAPVCGPSPIERLRKPERDEEETMERQTRDITGESVDDGAERELAKLIRKLR
jgi:hypothetical protein